MSLDFDAYFHKCLFSLIQPIAISFGSTGRITVVGIVVVDAGKDFRMWSWSSYVSNHVCVRRLKLWDNGRGAWVRRRRVCLVCLVHVWRCLYVRGKKDSMWLSLMIIRLTLFTLDVSIHKALRALFTTMGFTFMIFPFRLFFTTFFLCDSFFLLLLLHFIFIYTFFGAIAVVVVVVIVIEMWIELKAWKICMFQVR